MPLSITPLIGHLWPQLHATSEADVVFISQDTLIRFFTDALKSLAQRFGVFVVRHSTRSLIQGQLYYDAPPRHLSTLHVAILETGKPLVASSTKEQELRDGAFETTQATALKPIRWWIEDKAGVTRISAGLAGASQIHQIGIVPVPGPADSGNHWDMIYHAYPCSVLDGIETTKTVADYLEHCVMAEAWTPESDFSILESAQSYRHLADLYEAVFEHLWGKAQ